MTEVLSDAIRIRTTVAPAGKNAAAEDARPLRVLAVVDGSEAAGLVTKCLLDFDARHHGIEVVLLNVQPEPQEWRMRGYGWFHREEVRDRLVNDLGRRVVTSAARHLDGAGIIHKDRVELGEPVATILRCAAEEKCDMVVLAEPAPDRVRRLLMRKCGLAVQSVASVVIHFSNVPVLIAR